MNFELHKFKKISEDKKSAVLQHPLGHRITIAKNVLSSDLKKQVSSLPLHLAEGGEVPESDEDLEEEAEALPKGAGKAEEYQLAQNQDFQPQFPDVPSSQPEQAGPVAPTPEDKYNQNVEQNLSALKNRNIPYKLGMTSEEDLRKRAQEETLSQMAGQKQEEQQEAQNTQNLAQDHYAHDLAYIKSQNTQRQMIGLSPLPLPVPPMNLSNAVADSSQNTPAPSETPSAPVADQNAPIQAAPQNQNGLPQVQPNDPYGIKSQTAAQMQGYGEQRQSLQQEAEGQQQLNTAQQPALQQAVEQTQNVQKVYKDNFNKMMQEHQAFQNDLANQHIDPNRVLNNMGSGQKFSMGIGLILGGIGSAFTHTPNAALEVLNKQIDRDVDSQKAELGKKENLLSANMQMFPHMAQAAEVTKAQIAESLKSQIQATANQYQNPLIQARAQQAIGQIDAEKIAPALRMGAMMGSLSEGAVQDPASKLRMLGMAGIIPQQQQEAAFKELQTAQNMSRQRDNLIAAFNTVNENNTVLNKAAHLGFTPAKTQAAMEPLLAQLVKDSEGRITPTDVDMMRPLFPAPGDASSTVQLKKQQLLKFIDEKMHYPQLESLGINPAQASRFNAQGQKKFQLGPIAQGQ